MLDLQFVTDLLVNNPRLMYFLLAAFILVFVSLLSGWGRLDFLVMLKPQSLLHIALAVIIAFSLMLLNEYAARTFNEASATTNSNLWFFSGIRRFPLYVIALAYGPSAGLFTAALFAAFETTAHYPGLNEAVFALELTVLGWLAISPSPFKYRWAGPVNVVGAYTLAWATAGLALLEWQTGDITMANLWTQHRTTLTGVLLSMLLLLIVSPRFYRQVFSLSRIAPKRKQAPVAHAVIEPLVHTTKRNRETLTQVTLPDLTRDLRRKKELESPRFDDDI